MTNLIALIKKWNHRRKDRRRLNKQERMVAYKSMICRKAPYVLVTYIPYVFYINEKKLKFRHQNNQEQKSIVKVLNWLGYNVLVLDYMKGTVPKGMDVKAVFGIPPLFDKAKEMYPDALQIYYGTTASWHHQERMTIKRIDDFNKKNHCSVAYQRLPEHSTAEDTADIILQIGSEYTKGTYAEQIRDKIKLIHQSTTADALSCPTPITKRTDYVWFGSGGSILKGLDLLLDYFIQHPEKRLHVIGGPIEEDVMAVYRDLLTANIYIYGWLDTASAQFMEVVSQCAFMIFPSCSEGCPGSVLTMMKMGVIPIVSPWAACDGIENYGYIMRDLSVDSIEEGITWAERLTDEEKLQRSHGAAAFVAKTYNLERYERELEAFFIDVLGKNVY